MNLTEIYGISGAGHISRMFQMKTYPIMLKYLELKNKTVDLGAITILKWN